MYKIGTEVLGMTRLGYKFEQCHTDLNFSKGDKYVIVSVETGFVACISLTVMTEWLTHEDMAALAPIVQRVREAIAEKPKVKLKEVTVDEFGKDEFHVVKSTAENIKKLGTKYGIYGDYEEEGYVWINDRNDIEPCYEMGPGDIECILVEEKL